MRILSNTPCHSIPGGSVELLGAANCVTGAMTRVQLGRHAVLVDCGEPQGKDARGWQFPARAYGAQALVLTHGHFDHVSALPELLSRFAGPIYATAATLQIAELNLINALGLARASERRITEFRRRFRAQSVIVDYGQATALSNHGSGDAAVLRLHEAGHILGSASVELCSDDARILCSGDLGRPDSHEHARN